MLSEIWPVMDKCAVIAKKEIFYLWPFGLASWLWGTIFIDRMNVKNAQSTINKTGQAICQKKVISINNLKINRFFSIHLVFYFLEFGWFN